eukprot:2715417-Ditylum_brightwellii.AAC.1
MSLNFAWHQGWYIIGSPPRKNDASLEESDEKLMDAFTVRHLKQHAATTINSPDGHTVSKGVSSIGALEENIHDFMKDHPAPAD